MKAFKIVAVLLLAVGMLSTTAIAAPEDDCAGAIPVPVNSTSPALLPCADSTPTGPVGSCAGYGLPQYTGLFDVWVSFVATSTAARIRTDVGSTGSDSNYGVYSGSCGALTEIGCSEDEAAPYLGDICVGGLTVNDTYYVQLGVFCDGCFGACAGDYAVTVEDAPGAVCGDGVLSCVGDEECDDGNTIGGDCCSATCQLEVICGNGCIEGAEECDDGNVISGDGCSSTCLSELPKCGDGVINQVSEECDGADAAACPVGGSCNSYCKCIDGIPAVSEWGLVVLTLVGLVMGTILFGRRRAVA